MKDPLPHVALHDELKKFSKALTAKFSARTEGQPEAQLKSPVERLFTAYGKLTGHGIVLKDESAVGRIGRPDYAVESDGLLIGYIELKEPGKGANTARYKGHDADQWSRFRDLPNILYTSANEWALYRDGELVEKIVRLDGDACCDGEDAATENCMFEMIWVESSRWLMADRPIFSIAESLMVSKRSRTSFMSGSEAARRLRNSTRERRDR